ncbi:hypothetical protein L0657_12670 [Dyadobacter sp. CY345]|uniref:hypothetical protein n=1 Tax=Dyadobacter sp. CY345 TaxID=2909335 RepID=UPI001F22424C|nr:hypothetical protein [Dyadobacter sp. CY345]MCF2444814.1 hypothetical protein [Dyadobacter sp. CY345]
MEKFVSVLFVEDTEITSNTKKEDINQFEVEFYKWNLPRVGDHLMVPDALGDVHFFVVLSKSFLIKNGVMDQFSYVVKRHGHPKE